MRMSKKIGNFEWDSDQVVALFGRDQHIIWNREDLYVGRAAFVKIGDSVHYHLAQQHRFGRGQSALDINLLNILYISYNSD